MVDSDQVQSNGVTVETGGRSWRVQLHKDFRVPSLPSPPASSATPHPLPTYTRFLCTQTSFISARCASACERQPLSRPVLLSSRCGVLEGGALRRRRSVQGDIGELGRSLTARLHRIQRAQVQHVGTR